MVKGNVHIFASTLLNRTLAELNMIVLVKGMILNLTYEIEIS
jgi:hypothetical protein